MKHILILGMVLVSGICSAAVVTKDLRCEYLNDPLGIDATNPRLSWIISSNRRGETQTAYQILVASSLQLLNQDQGDLWDSGKVTSDESSQVVYAGTPLVSRERCFWKIRTWDRDGKVGDWSPDARWTMGLLQPTDWSAKWIAPDSSVGASTTPLIIRQATYEAVAQGQSVDVTSVLNDHIKQGRLKIAVNNKTLGVDPAVNVAKHLRVQYEYDGRILEKEVAENQTLVLPGTGHSPCHIYASLLPWLHQSNGRSSTSRHWAFTKCILTASGWAITCSPRIGPTIGSGSAIRPSMSLAW